MSPSAHPRRPGRMAVRLCIALACACALLLAGGVSSALAAGAPGWLVQTVAQPTAFVPGTQPNGADNSYVLIVRNDGSQPTDGSTVTITDTLPQGTSASMVSGIEPFRSGGNPMGCSGAPGSTVTCTWTQGALVPGQPLMVFIDVDVPAGASGPLSNVVSVTGGGAAPATETVSTPVSATVAPFGVQNFGSVVTDASGQPDTEAGDHPYEITTSFALTSAPGGSYTGAFAGYSYNPDPFVKDVVVDLPAGFVGDPQATPQCPEADLAGVSGCPVDTEIGTLTYFGTFGAQQGAPQDAPPQGTPIFNMVPESGYPAEFGTYVDGKPIMMFVTIRTGTDYGVRVTLPGVPAVGNLTFASLTFFGDPATDPSLLNGQTGNGTPSNGTGIPDLAFLRNPTDCSAGPLTTTIHVDSWLDPASANPDGTPDFSDPAWQSASSTAPAPTGCDSLSFAPSISVAPTTSEADSPTGLNVTLSVPQSAITDDGALASPDLKGAVIKLPAGLVVSPSSAGGLEGCSDQQIDLSSPLAGSCPLASQLGTVTVNTPLLSSPLTGAIYLGSPLCDPCTDADAQDGRMIRLFIQAQGSGVVVKLAGTVSVNPATGQLTATFDDNPQLPFSSFAVDFKTGPRAPLTTPVGCGTYTTTSDLSPWSAPSTPDATPSSAFAIGGCGAPLFSPSFAAGTQSSAAGAFSPFVMSFSRSDSDQFFSGLSVTLPPGVLAKLAGVPLCSDADANAGTCPASSQVGTVETAAGPGSEPYYLPGTAYLTGPYKGAPYGLSVVVPAVAGPFNLGLVVVRQALFVDPTTAQVTAVSDPFPTILAGIPLQIRRIDVDLDRPDFTVNPTSCDPMAITGQLTSTGGMSDAVSSRFQVGGCQALGFTPKLKMALTGKGKTRSGDHPALVSTLTQPFGQANIHNVRVALPLSLALDPNNSSHVCPYATAQAVHGGPVGCTASTIVGHATAVTPLLSEPLSGPVYLVQGIRYSHGVAIHTLPSLLIPLRGQIALDLRAQSSVSGGKLVTTFPTIPDAPVSKFTLQINGGRKGILVITGRGRSICGKPQVTNATLKGQNGKKETPAIRMSTPCGSKKKSKKKHKSKKHSTIVRTSGVYVARRVWF
jgi:hypothetical protein